MITATAIAISLASYHFNRDTEHNEVNPGVFVELNHDFVVGVYRNSHFRTTVLAARQWHLGSVGKLRVGVLAGVCSGYRTPVCGGLALSMGGVVLLLAPPTSSTSGVVGLSWRQPL